MFPAMKTPKRKPVPKTVAAEKVNFLASNILSGIAFDAAARSASDPDQHLVAVLFSAAWLEASLNELLHYLIVPSPGRLPKNYVSARLAAEAAGLQSQYASVSTKLRVLCAAMTGAPLRADRRPWRSSLLLIEVRNSIVHMRPELMKVREGRAAEPSSLVSREPHRLVRSLRDVGAIKAIPKGRLVPLAIASSLPGMGCWSYATTHATMVVVANWFPEWRQRILMSHRTPAAPQ